MSVLDLIDRLGEQESAFYGRTFISPVHGNTQVATRLERMVYTFLVPKNQFGWFKFQPVDFKRAKIIAPAEMDEIDVYVKQLIKVRMVLLMKQKGIYIGIPDKANNVGLSIINPMPVYLCNDYPSDFDRVIARFDGSNLWFERVDSGNDPAKGDYLRECFSKLLSPEKLKFSGLTMEEKHAYAFRHTLVKKEVEIKKQSTIQQDVEFAGGKFKSYEEKSDHFSVTYTVDGQQFTSRISKDPKRMVLSAGLCLAGDDHKFDLKSLVTVIREAQQKRLVHVGDYALHDGDEDW